MVAFTSELMPKESDLCANVEAVADTKLDRNIGSSISYDGTTARGLIPG